MIQEMPFEAFELQDQDETGEFHNQYLEFMQQHGTFDDTFMDRKREKRKKKQVSLDEFIDGEKEDKEE
jgi:hypothetical protein